MSYNIIVQPSGVTFEVEPEESILAAALRQGVDLPYGCRAGSCGSCKGQVVEGRIRYHPDVELGLSEEERLNGIALFCHAHAESDLRIEIHLVPGDNRQAIKKLPCRVVGKEFLSHDVVRLSLKTPPTESLTFRAGQYIDILLPDGERRSFSVANAPEDSTLIELHIRHVEGGGFTGYVFDELQEKAILRIEGLHGSFYLREDSARPVIFMAGGTGFAPVKGIIEHAIAQNITRPMHLYWGARAKRDLYMHTLAERWADELPHFSYIPVLSEPRAEDAWQGRTGYVHEAIMADFSDLSQYEIYAGGSPAMVNAGKVSFPKNGLSLAHYFSDAFEFQHPTPAP